MVPNPGFPGDITAPDAVGLTINKTVGTDANVCATTDSIQVDAGTRVTYCYLVTNTGDETLTTHTLVDDQLGTLLNNFPYNLAPSASVFLTTTLIIDSSVTNTATWTGWTARGVSTQHSDSATVTVIQPSLSLEKTVGTDASTCATTDTIEVDTGTLVTYCYLVTNTGSLPLNEHTLVDDQLGTLLNNFPYSLAPSASVFLTATRTINSSVTNTATWNASTPGGQPASDNDTATVTAKFKRYLPILRR